MFRCLRVARVVENRIRDVLEKLMSKTDVRAEKVVERFDFYTNILIQSFLFLEPSGVQR